ncbi:MAG: hypothetical protein K9L79_00445 [Methylobacter tundripaludum]|nr:hypothetical protein [Methylobacter tundripaludum]
MAKTIIIIEDVDTRTKSFEIKVLKFQTPDEQAAADTSAILIGDEFAAVLAHTMAKLKENKTTLPMQSAAHH